MWGAWRGGTTEGLLSWAACSGSGAWGAAPSPAFPQQLPAPCPGSAPAPAPTSAASAKRHAGRGLPWHKGLLTPFKSEFGESRWLQEVNVTPGSVCPLDSMCPCALGMVLCFGTPLSWCLRHPTNLMASPNALVSAFPDGNFPSFPDLVGPQHFQQPGPKKSFCHHPLPDCGRCPLAV